VKFSFFHLFRFRVDNTGVFQRVSMNPNMTVGQAACRLLCRYWLLNARNTLAASCVCWIVPLLRVNQAKELVTVRVWNSLDQSLKVTLQIRAIRAMCTTNLHIV